MKYLTGILINSQFGGVANLNVAGSINSATSLVTVNGGTLNLPVAGAVGDVLPNRALNRVIWHAVKGGAFVLNGTRSCAAQLVSYLALPGTSLTGTPISRKPSGDVTLDVWQAGLSDAAGVIRHLRWYQRQQEARTRALWRPPQPLPDVLDRGT